MKLYSGSGSTMRINDIGSDEFIEAVRNTFLFITVFEVRSGIIKRLQDRIALGAAVCRRFSYNCL